MYRRGISTSFVLASNRVCYEVSIWPFFVWVSSCFNTQKRNGYSFQFNLFSTSHPINSPFQSFSLFRNVFLLASLLLTIFLAFLCCLRKLNLLVIYSTDHSSITMRKSCFCRPYPNNSWLQQNFKRGRIPFSDSQIIVQIAQIHGVGKFLENHMKFENV
jgi:hypothetical protein